MELRASPLEEVNLKEFADSLEEALLRQLSTLVPVLGPCKISVKQEAGNLKSEK